MEGEEEREGIAIALEGVAIALLRSFLSLHTVYAAVTSSLNGVITARSSPVYT